MDVIEHGKLGTYENGCRCDDCTKAHRQEYMRKWARGETARVPAASAAKLVEQLIKQGNSVPQIANLVGVHWTTVYKIRRKQGYVNQATMRALEAAVAGDDA